MAEIRNWRDAKLPQWVKDSIEAETVAIRKAAALSWPTEAKPTPVPFCWMEYDKLRGEPVEGVYWSASGNCIHIRRKFSDEYGWKEWRFSEDGVRWHTSIVRGALFSSERDALLWLLWEKCDQVASELAAIKGKL